MQQLLGAEHRMIALLHETYDLRFAVVRAYASKLLKKNVDVKRSLRVQEIVHVVHVRIVELARTSLHRRLLAIVEQIVR